MIEDTTNQDTDVGAGAVITVTTLNELKGPERQFLMELFARGYTARTISKKMLAEFQVIVPDTVLLQGAVQYSDDIEEYRKELGRQAINAGAARKEERIRRLSELAEEWEDAAKANPKAAGVYLRTLDQIREETEPLGLAVPVDKADPWKMLLQQLAQSRIEQLPGPTPTNSEASSQPQELSGSQTSNGTSSTIADE